MGLSLFSRKDKIFPSFSKLNNFFGVKYKPDLFNIWYLQEMEVNK